MSQLAKKIARRRHALQWFAEQEADPAAALFQKPPSPRLRRLLLAEGLLDAEPVGQFKYCKWRVSPLGRVLVQPPC